VVGRQGESVDRAHAIGLLEAQHRRDPELKAEPDEQPEGGAGPPSGAHRSWKRPDRSAAAGPEGRFSRFAGVGNGFLRARSWASVEMRLET